MFQHTTFFVIAFSHAAPVEQLLFWNSLGINHYPNQESTSPYLSDSSVGTLSTSALTANAKSNKKDECTPKVDPLLQPSLTSFLARMVRQKTPYPQVFRLLESPTTEYVCSKDNKPSN